MVSPYLHLYSFCAGKCFLSLSLAFFKTLKYYRIIKQLKRFTLTCIPYLKWVTFNNETAAIIFRWSVIACFTITILLVSNQISYVVCNTILEEYLSNVCSWNYMGISHYGFLKNIKGWISFQWFLKLQ